MNVKGHAGGLIHTQVKVPPGCYLVRAFAPCHNVVTDWAWVNVGCDRTVCVDLVPPHIFHCIHRLRVALDHGTIDEAPVEQFAPKEIEMAREALDVLAERLPRRGLPDLPAADVLKAAFDEDPCNDRKQPPPDDEGPEP